MLKRLLPIALVGAVAATPAHAVLQIAFDVNGATFACVDNTGCDLNPALGTLELADQTLGGVQVNGSITASLAGAFNFLNTSSLSVVNDTASAVPITTTFGDTGFVGPVNVVQLSGSGTWQSAIGSSLALIYAADAANAQGANFAGDMPGTILTTFTSTASTVVQSFALNAFHPFAAAGPYSMTESASGVLAAGGQLLNRGQTMVASPIPEPSTWAMMLAGFAALAWAASRKGLRAA